MSLKIIPPREWSEGLRTAYRDAQSRLAQLQVVPSQAQAEAEQAGAEIRRARIALDAWKATLGKLPAEEQRRQAPLFSRASRAWYELASAFYGGSRDPRTLMETQTIPSTGLAPIVVAGVALAVGAVAFAPAAYQRARAIRQRAETELAELQARVKASQDGRTLQSSTLPPPPAEKGGAGLWIAATLGLLGLAGGGYMLARR